MADVELRYARDPRAVRILLQALPDWFGDPAAIESYTELILVRILARARVVG
ncbi:MAG: hypothetical protein WKF57_04720 [Nakamurella sp.]